MVKDSIDVTASLSPLGGVRLNKVVLCVCIPYVRQNERKERMWLITHCCVTIPARPSHAISTEGSNAPANESNQRGEKRSAKSQRNLRTLSLRGRGPQNC